MFVPVPVGIAAVMATSAGWDSPSSASALPNTAVYAGLPDEDARGFPVAGSCPGGSACHFSTCSPAGNPFPFWVMTCTSRGVRRSRTALSVSTRASMSCPSMGPK